MPSGPISQTTTSSHSEASSPDAVMAKHCSYMNEVVEEFSLLPPSGKRTGCSISALPSNNVFLFTGATGHLGSDILAQLLADDKVSRVYALNRHSHLGPSPQRVKRRFLEKGLDANLLQNGKIVYIDGDMTKPNFGLNKDILEELFRNTTTVLHNAWPSNFTRTLAQYRPSIIGLQNLIAFTHQAQKAQNHHLRFIYVSSFAAAQSWSTFHAKNELIPEDVLEKPEFGFGMGYGESKYAAEHIVARSGLQSTSVRVGQLCGRMIDGAWSTSEWVPLLLKESLTLKALPNFAGKIAFLPLNLAAEFMRDVSLAEKPLPPVLNLRHSRPCDWEVILHAAQCVLPQTAQLPVVHIRDWNILFAKRAAEIPPSEIKKHPVIKLAAIYSGLEDTNEPLENTPARIHEHFPYGTQEIARSLDISPTLQGAKAVTKKDAEQWTRHWLKTGFLNPDDFNLTRARL